MMLGIRLKKWLLDRKAQRDSGTRASETAQRVRALPAVSRLYGRLEEPVERSASDVLSLAREFIEDPQALSVMMGEMVAASEADPFYRPQMNLVLDPVHSGLVLFDHAKLTLTLAIIDADAVAAKRAGRRGGASIMFSGRRSSFHFIRSGGATLSLWEAPAIEPGFTASRSGRCRLAERVRISDGETLDLDGRRRTFIVEEALDDLVYIQAETPLEMAPLTAEYDSASLRLVGASSTDEASSRTQMMLALLRMMDRTDAVPVFENMLSSEHFFARWQTMREFLALDAEAALPHLRTMAAADPHREVRSAAARTLADFFAAETRIEEESPCPA